MPSYNFADIRAAPFPCREELLDGTPEMAPDGRLMVYPTDCFESTSGCYCLYVFGTTPSSRRVVLKVTGIYPSLVLERDIPKLQDLAQTLYTDAKIDIGEPSELPARVAKVGKGYTEEVLEVVDLYFATTSHRKTAITRARELGMRTFSDGTPWSFLDIFLTEELLSLADWWLVDISGATAGKTFPMKGGRVICHEIEPKNIACRSIPLDLKPRDPMFEQMPPFPSSAKTLSLTWDIETYSHNGAVPTGEHVSDVIFMIAGGVGWVSEREPFLKYCITCCPYARDHFDDSDPSLHVIYTDNEKDLLLAFAWLNDKFLPEYRLAFNNYGFDDPYLVRRSSEVFHVFPEMMGLMAPFDLSTLFQGRRGVSLTSQMTRKTRIKREAGTYADVTFLYVPGSINIDMFQCIPKLQTKKQELLESQALASYLDHYGLPNKLDVSPAEMFEAYKDNDGITMAHVMEYCIVDGISCQRLQCASSTLMQFIALAHSSFCSVSDAINKANANKVKNNIYALGRLHNYLYTEEHEKPEGKYPGAEVLTPITGIHKKVPIFALDFASLYPSIIRSLNMSSETYVKDDDMVNSLRDRGYEVFTYSWEDIGVSGNGTTKASFVRKYPDGTPFPSIYEMLLTKYLSMRNAFKKMIKASEKALEMEQDPDIRRKHLLDISEQDNNQKAVKVLMNTFYGVLGQKDFPLCEIAMSTCICMFGRKCLGMAKTSAEAAGCTTIYGDTDSIFVSPPIPPMNDLSDVPRMLAATSDIAGSLLVQINAAIAEMTGNSLIRMEYDKLLFPMVLLSKKQYYGTAWDPYKAKMKEDNPYVSGLPYRKRGKTKALKEVAQKVVARSLDLSTDDPIMDVVTSVLCEARDEISTRPIEDLTRRARMNPGKSGNANKFAARMEERYRIAMLAGDEEGMKLFMPPKPGEYFEYVVCERGGSYEFVSVVPSRCGTCTDCSRNRPCLRCRKCRLGGLCPEAIAGNACKIEPCCLLRVHGRGKCSKCHSVLGFGKVTGPIVNRCSECDSERKGWCDECKAQGKDEGKSPGGKKRNLGTTDRWEYKEVYIAQKLTPDYSYYITDIINSLARFISSEMVPDEGFLATEQDEKKIDDKRKNLAVRYLENILRGDDIERLGLNNEGKKKAKDVLSRYCRYLPCLGITFANLYHMSHSHASPGNATIFMKIIAGTGVSDRDIASVDEAKAMLMEIRDTTLSRFDLGLMYQEFLKDMTAAENQKDRDGLKGVRERYDADALNDLIAKGSRCKAAIVGAIGASTSDTIPSCPAASERVVASWLSSAPSDIVSFHI